MTDQQIIDALIERDERVTKRFFFENCRPLFVSIIRHVFSYEVDYDEFVNELYVYIMENDAYRLKQFKGRSSIYQWLKVVAIRFFMAKRNKMIENDSKDYLIDVADKCYDDKEDKITSRIDISRLLSSMTNKRYAYVIRRLVLQDAEPLVVAEELSITIDNLYNVKKRAVAALTEMVLKENSKYEKEIVR